MHASSPRISMTAPDVEYESVVGKGMTVEKAVSDAMSKLAELRAGLSTEERESFTILHVSTMMTNGGAAHYILLVEYETDEQSRQDSSEPGHPDNERSM